MICIRVHTLWRTLYVLTDIYCDVATTAVSDTIVSLPWKSSVFSLFIPPPIPLALCVCTPPLADLSTISMVLPSPECRRSWNHTGFSARLFFYLEVRTSAFSASFWLPSSCAYIAEQLPHCVNEPQFIYPSATGRANSVAMNFLAIMSKWAFYPALAGRQHPRTGLEESWPRLVTVKTCTRWAQNFHSWGHVTEKLM